MGYPGSKTASGVLERTLSLMPRHRVFVDAFMGSAAVSIGKLDCEQSYLLDADRRTIAEYGDAASRYIRSGGVAVEVICCDSVDWLRSQMDRMDIDWLVYCDPPYLGSTRSRRYYRCELWDAEDHRRLLEVVRSLPCFVMVAGRPSSLYSAMLPGWRVESFPGMTRRGIRTECVWMNYADGVELHDTRFIGRGFRERERIKRKRDRWVSRFKAMPAAERQVIREALDLSSPATWMPAARGADDRTSLEVARRTGSSDSTMLPGQVLGVE